MKPKNNIYIGGPALDPPDEEDEFVELDEPEGDYSEPNGYPEDL